MVEQGQDKFNKTIKIFLFQSKIIIQESRGSMQAFPTATTSISGFVLSYRWGNAPVQKVSCQSNQNLIVLSRLFQPTLCMVLGPHSFVGGRIKHLFKFLPGTQELKSKVFANFYNFIRVILEFLEIFERNRKQIIKAPMITLRMLNAHIMLYYYY